MPFSSLISRRKRPLLATVVSLVVLQACGGGGGGGSGQSREELVASIPEGCRFLGDPSFGLSTAELIEARDNCLFESPEGSGPANPLAPTDDQPGGAGTTDAPVESLEPTSGSSVDAPTSVTPMPVETPVTTPVEMGAQVVADGETGPADIEGSSFLISQNNSARLTGESFGRGTQPNASLRRAVPVTLATPSADIEIEAAHVVGEGLNFYVIATLTNRSNARLCDIDLGVVQLVDRQDRVTLEGDDFLPVRVEGSLARSSTGQLLSRCLAPGETSYSIMIVIDDVLEAENLAFVAVDEMTFDDSPSTAPDATFLPVSYVLSDSGTFADVTVRSNSLVAVESAFAVMIVLDEAGYPVDFTNALGEGEVAPGGDVVFRFRANFDGRTDTIRVIARYRDLF